MCRSINTAAVSENPADCVLLLRIPCSAVFACDSSSSMFPIGLPGTPDGASWQSPLEFQTNEYKSGAQIGHRRGFSMNIFTAVPKYLLALSTVALMFASLTWAADDKDQSDIQKRIDTSASVLNEIMATPDKAIPDSIMEDAKCIAVVPSMIKIAIGIGGTQGNGVATGRTAR